MAERRSRRRALVGAAATARTSSRRPRTSTEEQIAEQVVCGPDVDRYLEKITEFEDAGFDHVYLHQVGRDQESFFQFAERELLVKV